MPGQLPSQGNQKREKWEKNDVWTKRQLLRRLYRKETQDSLCRVKTFIEEIYFYFQQYVCCVPSDSFHSRPLIHTGHWPAHFQPYCWLLTGFTGFLISFTAVWPNFSPFISFFLPVLPPHLAAVFLKNDCNHHWNSFLHRGLTSFVSQTEKYVIYWWSLMLFRSSFEHMSWILTLNQLLSHAVNFHIRIHSVQTKPILLHKTVSVTVT